MIYYSGHVMTLANSIIGVSVLAMPYCFKQCGIILSVLMLIISSIIARLTCHFLLKSAIIARRRTFEYLAYYIFGGMGKFVIEVGIIGFLIGTCIAFLVVMGDLAPEIISEITGHHTSNALRTSVLMALALFCVLPLGLLRNVDSLSGVSRATIGFYFCLVLKIVFEALPHIITNDWYNHVVLWRPLGILQCLPIFAMALSCQTQLFEIYQVLHNPTLEEMNSVVRVAVNICTSVYIFVGIFGYIAFAQRPFTGNILLSFSPSIVTDIIKVGFVLSVAFSFPLVIFPCRASLYSLLYKEGYSLHEGISNYIPEGKFKALTFFIVFISLIIAIMIPNIELVLGLVGSTIGIVICVLFPVTCFIYVSSKKNNEMTLAKAMLIMGIIVMILGTFENLNNLDNIGTSVVQEPVKNFNTKINVDIDESLKIVTVKFAEKISTTKKLENKQSQENKVFTDIPIAKITDIPEVRHEPPQPIEPQETSAEKVKPVPKVLDTGVLLGELQKNQVIPSEKNKNIWPVVLQTKQDEVDIEAIKKEENESHLQELEKDNTHQVLIDTIQKQSKVQEKIVEQQRKLIEVIQQQQGNVGKKEIDMVNEEKLKAVKQIESIAQEAIERIISGKDSEKQVDLKNDTKDIDQNEIVMENKESKMEKKSLNEKLNNLKVNISMLNTLIQNDEDMNLEKKNIRHNERHVLENRNDSKLNQKEERRPQNIKENNPRRNINKNLSNDADKLENTKQISEKYPSNMLPLPIAVLNKLNLNNTNISNFFKNSSLMKNKTNIENVVDSGKLEQTVEKVSNNNPVDEHQNDTEKANELKIMRNDIL